jgi:hypothetical protein
MILEQMSHARARGPILIWTFKKKNQTPGEVSANYKRAGMSTNQTLHPGDLEPGAKFRIASAHLYPDTEARNVPMSRRGVDLA